MEEARARGNRNLALVTLCLSLFSLALHYYIVVLSSSTDVSVLIIVLSHRDNFDRRQAIRETWMSRINKSNVKVAFVVGDKACDIQASDLLDPYSCDPLPLNTNQIEKELVYKASNLVTRNDPYDSIQHGFSFQVTSDSIILKSVSCIFVHGHSCETVKLSHVINDETLLNINMSMGICSSHGTESSKCDYATRKLDESVLLPRGFVGFMTAEYIFNDTYWPLHSSFEFSDTTGLVIPLRTHTGDRSRLHRASDRYSLSFQFEMADRSSFLQKLFSKEQLRKDLALRNAQNSLKLTDEGSKYGDILFVDVIDVYRNLPVKLIKSIELGLKKHSPKFLVKTDDDCYLNVTGITSKLEQFDFKAAAWIAKELWPVDFYGKWAENEYHSVSYPPFACGSGYVISRPVAKWIASNAQFLHPFQGEDVSLGIWLASLGPSIRIQEDLFQCEYLPIDQVVAPFYSIPDLEPGEIRMLHQQLERERSNG